MLRNNADARRCSYFELGLPVFTQDSINFRRSVRLFSVGSEFHAWFEINVTLRQESNEARLEQDFANYHFVSSFRKRPATRHYIRPSEQRKN